MIGGGVATPPGTVESVATIGEMVVDGIGSASVGGSATSGSGSGSPATGNAAASRNPANGINCDAKDISLNDKCPEKVDLEARRDKGLCIRDEDETSGPPVTGVMLTRPWEPPPPATSPSLARSHLQQLHHQHRQIHAAQHHQQIGVPQPPPLIDG